MPSPALEKMYEMYFECGQHYRQNDDPSPNSTFYAPADYNDLSNVIHGDWARLVGVRSQFLQHFLLN